MTTAIRTTRPARPGSASDAVDVLASADPDFPWADYDIEDVADADGDLDFNEPDGVIDHLVLVHAGEDASGGGGAQGTEAIWAHSSAVIPGHTIPGTDIVISNYIVQPEDSGVGVFAHEYGHDLGLPDLYDVGSGGDSDVDFWDLMSSGSHSGPVFQGIPTHMGLWDKFVLGWADPLILNPGDPAQTVKLGQTSRTPVGTEDGIRVNLPAKVVSLSDAAQRGRPVVEQQRPVVGRCSADSHDRRAGRQRHQALDVEQLRHRGGLGLRLRRGLDRRWRRRGSSRRSSTRPTKKSPPRTTTPTRTAACTTTAPLTVSRSRSTA